MIMPVLIESSAGSTAAKRGWSSTVCTQCCHKCSDSKLDPGEKLPRERNRSILKPYGSPGLAEHGLFVLV